jgi:hypothetical protein
MMLSFADFVSKFSDKFEYLPISGSHAAYFCSVMVFQSLSRHGTRFVIFAALYDMLSVQSLAEILSAVFIIPEA